MSQPVDDIRISKFQQDRKLLPYNDAEIAEFMKIGRANYSSYVNGRYPITNAFLKKFYTAFEEQLTRLRHNNTLNEDGQRYNTPKDLEKEMTELSKKTKNLEDKYDRLIESYQLVSIGILHLEKKIEQMTKDTLNKIETLLSDPDDPKIKHKKKPGG